MSLKEYNNLNKEIQRVYVETCIPCMESRGFRKGNCKECDTMRIYVDLQEKKEIVEGAD